MNAKDSPEFDATGAPTLHDVAKRLGLAVSTVSRALSGHPAISDKTRVAVQAAAAELGYRLPTQGRGSRKSATHLVGVVVGAMHNRFMTVLLEHLHDALEELGYQVVLLIDSMTATKDLLAFRPLIDGYLDGIIFATATIDSPLVSELERRGIPCVLVVRSVDNANVDTVEIDNIHAGSEAVRHLFELGHRRISLVMGPANTSTSRDRVRGALDWLQRNGVPKANVQLIQGDYTHEAGYSAGMAILGQVNRVTAIVGGNDTVALGVLEAARRQGISVPSQLSVIGFDDMPLAGSPLIGLTSIRQPVKVMARTAAQRLVERMRSHKLQPARRDILPIELIRRDTTGPVPAKD
ncbi:MAG TPA: LacI family DNA-binding transcriptional regulator [Burkholderiaceae bacterium]|nr:LacI family DNA-binding transcriptional regulator [Burkholderiaceae bacterium]